MSRPLIGSFDYFCEHCKIITHNALVPSHDDRASLLDRSGSFREAVSEFADMLNRYISSAAKRPARRERNTMSETSADIERRSYVVDGGFTPIARQRAGYLYPSSEKDEAMAAIAANPPYRHTDCESWFDRLYQIKKAANMSPREVAKLALEEDTWLALVRRLPGANIGDEEAKELRVRMLNYINCEVI